MAAGLSVEVVVLLVRWETPRLGCCQLWEMVAPRPCWSRTERDGSAPARAVEDLAAARAVRITEDMAVESCFDAGGAQGLLETETACVPLRLPETSWPGSTLSVLGFDEVSGLLVGSKSSFGNSCSGL